MHPSARAMSLLSARDDRQPAACLEGCKWVQCTAKCSYKSMYLGHDSSDPNACMSAGTWRRRRAAGAACCLPPTSGLRESWCDAEA